MHLLWLISFVESLKRAESHLICESVESAATSNVANMQGFPIISDNFSGPLSSRNMKTSANHGNNESSKN